MSETERSSAPAAWILLPKDAPRVEIWGLTPERRLRRAFESAGCRRIESGSLESPPPLPRVGSVVLARGDLVMDPRIAKGLLETENVAVVLPGGEPVAAHVDAERAQATLASLCDPGTPLPAGVETRAPEAIAPAYVASLRKADSPYLFYAPRAADARAIEDELFAASYKTITDLITLWLWPRPAAAATRALARRGVHPNTVTAASWLLALLVLPLFASGAFGWGLVAAWGMTFLDTVDGKLARVTLTSSRFGHVFDHGLDILHPPFWYLAFGWGLSGTVDAVTWIVVGGYVAGRLLELAFMGAFGLETHSWRPLDSLFRTITARRNPNLILLTVGALAGRPDLGFTAVAIWTGVCLGFHSVRLLQAFAEKSRGNRVSAWNEAAPGVARPSGR